MQPDDLCRNRTGLRHEDDSPAVRDIRLELPDWGEWTRIDSYYISGLEGRPSVRRCLEPGHLFDIDLPEGWDGKIELTYSIHTSVAGSGAHRRKAILPARSETYSCGFSLNTLTRPSRDGDPLEMERTVHLEAPSGWKIATGWAGMGGGKQTVSKSTSIF